MVIRIRSLFLMAKWLSEHKHTGKFRWPATTRCNTAAVRFHDACQVDRKLAKTCRSRTADLLTEAESKILAALGVQEGYACLPSDGEPLPSNGEKTVATSFSKQNDGWWSSVRYGQISIPIDGEKTDMLIGELKDVMNFYAAVKMAIGTGALVTKTALDAAVTSVRQDLRSSIDNLGLRLPVRLGAMLAVDVAALATIVKL